MQTLYTLQNEWGQFFAATVLEIQAVPPRLSSAFISALLAGFEAPDTSIELVLLSDEDQRGRVRMMLLLRQSGNNPHAISNDLNLRQRVLEERLGKMGFQTAALDAEACFVLAKRMAVRRDVTLCYPGENLRRVRFCYAPGGYDAVAPVDLAEIASVLTDHEDAGFSVQMNAARLLPEEERLVRENLGWLTRKKPGPEVAQAAQAFNAALSMAGTAACFVAITAWGDDESMQIMLQSMRQRGFTTQMLPPELLRRCDYMGDAPRVLSGYVAAEAHAVSPGIFLPNAMRRLTHLASPRLLGALLLPRDGLVAPSGMKVNRIPKDDSPLPSFLVGEGVAMGTRSTDGVEVRMPLDHWSKHAMVVGMPGTGKTTFLFHLLLEMYEKHIPFLAIEPVKTEYRALLEVIPELKVYTPGNSGVAPLMFNPFLPPSGVTLEKYLPHLETAFLTAFSMPSPLDVIFPEVLRTCYTRYGWRMDSTPQSQEARPFGMREFIAVFREEVRRSGYDGESRANLESGGVYRFQSLLNNNNVLFDTDRALPMDEFFNRPVLIELDAIGNPEQKTLLLSLLLIQLNLVIHRDQALDGRLKNVLMIDEAHVLLSQSQRSRDARDADPTGRAVTFLQQMVRQNRAYGTGMIFADQSPVKLGTDIVGNSDIQLIFRLNSASDRRMFKENMELSDETADAIEALAVGQCYLKAQGLDKPMRLVTPDVRRQRGMKSMISDETVRERYGNVPCPFSACACKNCDISIRNEAEFIARSIADGHRDELADSQKAEEFIRSGVMNLLNQAVRNKPERDRLFACAKMFLLRRLDDLIAQVGR